MSRNLLRAAVAVTATLALGRGIAAQAARVSGTWDVHIEHFTGRIVDEQWIVQQNGRTVTGRVVVRGGREYPLQGNVDGNRINVRVTVSTDGGDRYNTFLGTVAEGRITGEIKKENDDGTFSAKRTSD